MTREGSLKKKKKGDGDFEYSAHSKFYCNYKGLNKWKKQY